MQPERASGHADDARLPAPPTLLTGARRRAGLPAAGNAKRTTVVAAPRIPGSACAECGAPIPVRQRRCSTCHVVAKAARLLAQQAAEAEHRHTTGDHPSQRPAVRTRISERQRAQWESARHSRPVSGFTGHPSEFRRLILPNLSGMKPSDLASATGLSRGYCAQIRDGRRTPAARHWAVLHLAGLNAQQAAEAS